MPYRDNVDLLCAKMGVSNPVREEDLKIERFYFLNRDNSLLTIIERTPMNRAGRLFIEFLFNHSLVSYRLIQDAEKSGFGNIDDLLVFYVGRVSKHIGELHFAELWKDAEGKRALIEAFQHCWKIGVKHKRRAESRP